jgi:transcriptional regulator with XRE-family HTH domain
MEDGTRRGPLTPPTEATGQTLAGHRKRAGLSGSQLARRVGISQSKISRLENGLATASGEEIERIAGALNLSATEVRRLIDHAAHDHDPPVDWRLEPGNIARKQGDVARIEQATHLLLGFSPTTVMGLLQTSEYARGIMTDVHALLGAEQGDPETEVIFQSVTARMARQQVLADPTRQFRMIMPEHVLANRVCGPTEMLAQIQRIRRINQERDNVTIAFIPLDTPQGFPSTPDFVIYDDTHVLIDLPSSAVALTNAADIALYRRLFDLLENSATTDIDPILDKYRDVYYERARPHRE